MKITKDSYIVAHSEDATIIHYVYTDSGNFESGQPIIKIFDTENEAHEYVTELTNDTTFFDELKALKGE
jgi:hypothetical protein